MDEQQKNQKDEKDQKDLTMVLVKGQLMSIQGQLDVVLMGVERIDRGAIMVEGKGSNLAIAVAALHGAVKILAQACKSALELAMLGIPSNGVSASRTAEDHLQANKSVGIVDAVTQLADIALLDDPKPGISAEAVKTEPEGFETQHNGA